MALYNLVKQHDPVEVRVKESPVAGRRAGSWTAVEEHHRLQNRSTRREEKRWKARLIRGSANWEAKQSNQTVVYGGS